MPVKGRGTSDLREIDRRDHGIRWLAYLDETMQRTSHTVEIDGDVWLFDPVDAPGVDDLFAEFGDVVDVVVGLDRHKHGSATLVNRHKVPVYATSWMAGVTDELNATVERFGTDLTGSGFEAFRLIDRSVSPRQEVGFYHGGYDLLVVPESVDTIDYSCAYSEHLGVHPMLRSFPPRYVPSRCDPDRLLVGHSAGVPVDAGGELQIILENVRRNLPSVYTRAFTSMLSN